MRKVNLIVVALVAIYLLAASLALGQNEKIAEVKGGDVEEQIAGDPTLQAPCAHVEIKDGKEEVEWDLIYPASKASYVGGTVKKMHMSKGLQWLLLRDRQFSRKGRIALTPGCLLFVFNNDKKDSFKDSLSLKTHFRILRCSNEEKKNRGGACTLVRDQEHPRSYVLTIPYAKVSLLSRAKYETSDLTSVSVAYAGAAGSILSGIHDSVDVDVLGGVAGFLTVYYYLAVARPRMGDNYIAVFVEPAPPQIKLWRDESNHITAITALPHYFRVGQQIEISGVANSKLVDIATISRNREGKVTVTTKEKHGLPLGAQVQIADVADPSLNGQFQVASTDAQNEKAFTYEQKDNPKEAESHGGEVQDVWNGTFVVESVDRGHPTKFTYWQVGPVDWTGSRERPPVPGAVPKVLKDLAESVPGAAEVAAPGTTKLTVDGTLDLNQPGAEKRKPVDLTGTATLKPPLAKSDELFKKGDLVMFRIANHHDYYNISMILSSGTGLTFVSETAEKTGK